jgi:hypothetical protein
LVKVCKIYLLPIKNMLIILRWREYYLSRPTFRPLKFVIYKLVVFTYLTSFISWLFTWYWLFVCTPIMHCLNMYRLPRWYESNGYQNIWATQAESKTIVDQILHPHTVRWGLKPSLDYQTHSIQIPKIFR